MITNILLIIIILFLGYIAKFLRDANTEINVEQRVDYQTAVESIKAPKEYQPPKITGRGRKLVDQSELVDLADLDPEIGIKALEELGNI